VTESLTGLPNFLVFFGIAIALTATYLLLYTLATAHNEFLLIRQNVISAAVALGFSLVGFALPLASAIVHAQNILDCLIWGLVALAVQIFAYWTVRLVMRDLSQRIAAGEMAAALFLGAASLSAGIINAAAMTF
jgi:putative membrane protein